MAEELSMRMADLRGGYYRQFLRFCLVGSAGTAVHYSALIAIVNLRGTPVAGSAVGFVLGALVNYMLNYHYTFYSAKPYPETLLKFFIIACIGLALNTVTMGILIGLLHLHYFISQLLATAGVVLWNFAMNARWTFRHG
jgi:putative flippase GtrA